MVFFMISRGIEINEFTCIRLTSEVKFGDDPSNHYPTQRRIQNPAKHRRRDFCKRY